MLLATERAAVVQACRRLRRDGLVVGTAGNVSVRAGELIAVSPSGLDYDVLTPELVGVVLPDGSPVQAVLAPTSELPLHLAVYAAGQAAAIVHTHGVASTALSTVLDEIPASHYYSALYGGTVRVAPYATYGSAELAARVAAALTGRSAALLSNHGAVTTGASLPQAVERAAYLEWICEVHLRALSTGLPIKLLQPTEIDRVARLLAGYGQRPPDPVG
jgi:L-fuculose-phosphate aldolase